MFLVSIQKQHKLRASPYPHVFARLKPERMNVVVIIVHTQSLDSSVSVELSFTTTPLSLNIHRAFDVKHLKNHGT